MALWQLPFGLSHDDEFVDQRVTDHSVADEISIGQYVLTNEALARLDAVMRLVRRAQQPRKRQARFVFERVPDHPQYSGLDNFKSWKVPQVLLFGASMPRSRSDEKNGPLKLTRQAPSAFAMIFSSPYAELLRKKNALQTLI
jgi:tRNA (guanine-N1)-methyltransferase